jgi:3'(2'), 5'-bisphosphate nucleotidase
MAWKAKDDASPVSVADEAAQAVILEGLRRHLPDLPIVSEESDYHGMAPGPDFVLVDPLDGTKSGTAAGAARRVCWGGK